MKLWLTPIMALALASTAAHAQSSMRVTTTGEVANPGDVVLEGKPRLADAVKVAKVNRDAYVLGAAWLRPSLQAQQKRLKVGLVYELGIVGEKTVKDRGQESLATFARSMRNWVSGMPVTGRQVVRTLEPHALQVSPPDNLLLSEGDHLIYPSRPQTVTVVGAVEQACDLPHTGLKDARDYLAECVASSFADPDTVYVIEPDGNVFEQGIALWNRSPAMPVAPGATLYVPLRHWAIANAADEDFNRDMASFIATQPLGGSGMRP